MESPDSNNCELPSEKYYSKLDNVTETETTKNICDSYENVLNKYPDLMDFCRKLENNLQILKKSGLSDNAKKQCTHMKHWLHHNVINTAGVKSPMFYISTFYTVWFNATEDFRDSINEECKIKFPAVSIDYRVKWKKMHDYNYNYKKVKCALQNKEDCKEHCKEDCREKCREDYCKYIVEIFNIYKEFEHVCASTNEERCPEYWNEFQTNYLIDSDIELMCKEVHDKLGFYKVKMSLEIEGEEKYVEQYESAHMFSFFEKLIGYSIKKILSKSLYYSKYILLPILLILLFYFFMKKLSFFGSKIAPKADDMRKMLRNVQGITNPETLLHPPKPPFGGNKMGLSYTPK
ncbi:PIR Superfamily Protein [Plasmodium ovale wallikeri]|uniref:PIR Superfamily Protein n=1 Tax=Plasmodium ovale wallikeri TaxID=864142 RepID=A0A1A9ASQ0_PLAOA|nr:PIR Superfamily Protein [Plasmodium ovale wallikeri]SBT59274.1 PIR Superfamily Protein [Plasmodium ovale wallikeri]